jgi:hypothetical protein
MEQTELVFILVMVSMRCYYRFLLGVAYGMVATTIFWMSMT